MYLMTSNVQLGNLVGVRRGQVTKVSRGIGISSSLNVTTTGTCGILDLMSVKGFARWPPMSFEGYLWGTWGNVGVAMGLWFEYEWVIGAS